MPRFAASMTIWSFQSLQLTLQAHITLIAAENEVLQRQ
jgi:hypothetical protein